MIAYWSAAVTLWIALILLSAAVAGARAQRAVAGDIDAYRVLPDGTGRWFAPVLMLAQTLAAVLILIPATRVAGAVLTVLLLGLFIAAIALNIRRGTTDFGCGCAGPHHIRPGAPLLLRNAVLFFAALAVAVSPVSPYDVWHCAVACLLFLGWLFVNAMIAASQWPRDD